MAISPQRRGWIVVAASTLAIVFSVNTIIMTPLSVMMDPISQEFGWSRSDVSNGVSVFALTAAIFMPFAGRLLDAIGIRKLGIPSVLLTVVMLIALAFVPANKGIWFLLLGVVGVLSVGQGGLTYVKVAAQWIDKRRGIAVGVVGTGLAIGQVIAPAITLWAMTYFGTWRAVFIIMAIGVAVFSLPMLITLIREPNAVESRALGLSTGRTNTSNMPGLTVGEAVRTRQFWILLFTTFALGSAIPGALVHMVPNLTDQGVSPAQAAFALSLAGMATMAGRLVGGFLVDKLHAPYVAFVVFLVPVLGFFFLSGLSGAIWLALLGAVLIGTAMGGESDLVSYMTSRYMGLKRFGAIYGIYYAMLALGYSIGPAAYALSYSLTGNYKMAMLVFAIMLVIGALLGLTLGKYRYPPGIAIPVADDPETADELSAEGILVDNPVIGSRRRR